ncbi:hypothetical protein PHJA_002526700 [Phtheirospermum japonicum]|uniref:Uncharacterized protein n=1 Tax=Phtheirospermum japonicum TaxID=374723 RepID=A0A830D1U6_9LAMI|nr:hypothetical protein PHJA_002526700 [Phtheirospermum japonicum]
MGNCRSRESIRSDFTAKLILQNGQLREFTCPIKVSDLLQQNPSCFICSADEMEFDQFAVEIGGDEVLRLGEVYFELPLGWRSQRLQAEDMAALAVKASLALSTSGYEYDDEMMRSCGCCAPRKVEPTVSFFSEKERPPVDGYGGKGRRKLSAIIEE